MFYSITFFFPNEYVDVKVIINTVILINEIKLNAKDPLRIVGMVATAKPIMA